MSKKSKFTGYILISISVFTWSIGEIFLKIVQDYIGVYAYIFWRLISGGAFLVLILAIQKDFSGMGKMVKNNSLILISCIIILSSSSILFYIGITNTLANMGAVLCSTSPIWITIFAFFILKEKNNLKTKSIGLVIGVIGVTILLTQFDISGFISSEFLFGNAMALGAEISWSLYTILGRKIQENEKDTSNLEIKFTTLSLLLSCIPIFILLIFSSEFSNFLNYPFEVWLFVIGLGIINSALAFFLFFKGLQQVDTSKGASLIFLKPIISTILAFLILNEVPTIFLIVSSILIIIAIYIINLDSKIEEETVITF
ncbi:MAG: EamA family transporter [Candidatus Helarchaeota archaeon]|nr:EamA family transporter [Candidatus Helarchaeota archaeon]